MRDPPYRGVPRGAPEGRVVQIQRIDVDREHGDPALFPMRDRPVALHQFLEVRQGVQSRQPIVAPPGRSAGEQRSKSLRDLGSIACDLPRCGDVPRIADPALASRTGTDRHFVPKQRSVLAIIAQQHPAGFAAAQGLAQTRRASCRDPGLATGGDCCPISSARLAGERLEGGVDINDRLLGFRASTSATPSGEASTNSRYLASTRS